MSMIKLPYLGNDAYGNKSESPIGYSEISGFDKYKDASLRNVRVVRVDLLLYLSSHFCEETVRKYRSALYYILAGYGRNKQDKMNLITESLKNLYKTDEVFRIKLGKIVYFRDTDLEELCIYDALLEDVKREIPKIEEEVSKLVPHIKNIGVTHLYAYFSVNNTTPIVNLLSIKGLELVSK